MPDFDRFERLLRDAMSMQDPSPIITDLTNIPNNNRPRLFKNRTNHDIRLWIYKAHNSIRSLFDQTAILSTSDINIGGSDLLEENTNTHIELKTGQVTNANIGLSTMAWAMGDPSPCALKEILSQSMVERRTMALDDNIDGIQQSQRQTMARLESYFLTRASTGKQAPPNLQHFARCVARGITNKKEAERLLGQKESHWNTPIILHANWTCGWKLVTTPFSARDAIVVKDIGFAHSDQIASAKIPRVSLRLLGTESFRSALFYPNYKNSYRKGSIRIPAKYWVQTACFHVWIDK